jgi:septal ring factor EnvC (AmiA/AmiB activator)
MGVTIVIKKLIGIGIILFFFLPAPQAFCSSSDSLDQQLDAFQDKLDASSESLTGLSENTEDSSALSQIKVLVTQLKTTTTQLNSLKTQMKSITNQTSALTSLMEKVTQTTKVYEKQKTDLKTLIQNKQSSFLDSLSLAILTKLL